MHFKNVILKDSFDDIKSALDSREVRMISLIVGQINFGVLGELRKTKIKHINVLSHSIIKSLNHSVI